MIKEVTSDDSGNRRNAAYAIGVWAEFGGEAAHPHLARLLGALHPLFNPKEAGGEALEATFSLGSRSFSPINLEKLSEPHFRCFPAHSLE